MRKRKRCLWPGMLAVFLFVGACSRNNPAVSENPPEVTAETQSPTSTVSPTATSSPTPTVSPMATSTSVPKPAVFPAEITRTNFPEQILYEKATEADTNGDGMLSEEEAKTVTKFHIKKLADEDIKDALEDETLPEYSPGDFFFDFEGIQYFTELSELTVNLLGGEAFVEGNKEDIPVETANFHRVCECTRLKKLCLYEVDIVSLELSAFPELKRLELNDMYRLETLEIGNHKKLSSLWITESHKLKDLDVSGLKNIKTVDFVRNDGLEKIVFGEANEKLEIIQLNGLKKLYGVDLSVLGGLKSLNLTDVALKSLDVSKNGELDQLCGEGLHLETLDLRNNPKISYVINARDSFKEILLPEENVLTMIRWTDSEITEFPELNLNPETLTGIDIQGTKIKEIDVSGYPKLEYFYYDDVTKVRE